MLFYNPINRYKRNLKILTILGADPGCIKVANFEFSIRNHNAQCANAIKEVIVQTGQYCDPNISNVSFEELVSVSYLEMEARVITY